MFTVVCQGGELPGGEGCLALMILPLPSVVYRLKVICLQPLIVYLVWVETLPNLTADTGGCIAATNRHTSLSIATTL